MSEPSQVEIAGTEVSTEPEQPKKPRRPRKRVDAGKIPERAWAAADYLRSRLLEESPTALISTKRWDSKTGHRLSWAHGFDLLHQAVLKAIRSTRIASEADAWEEIARTVKWLFDGQTATHRFVVRCPDTLRDKWDRIQEQRRNADRKAAQPAPRRDSHGRPDPQSDKQFTWLGK